MNTVTEKYGIQKTVALSYDEALAKVKAALQKEGFGVLSEIDIREKLKEKLGVDYRHYMILGACNPPLAYKALQAEPQIGLLLPCNVVVYDAENGGTVVAAIDPDSMVQLAGDDAALAEVAKDARARLERAIEAL